jgi:N utilization substance protein A
MNVDHENRAILVVVPHDQLSLAIGKRGQNARLASRLIGWNIDIRSDQEGTAAAHGPEDGVPEDGAPEDEAPVNEIPEEEGTGNL